MVKIPDLHVCLLNYTCARNILLCVSLHFLTGITPSCLSRLKSSATSSGKPFLIILITDASARSTHYTLSCHILIIISFAFLNVLKKIIKICIPGTYFLAPRTHSIVFGQTSVYKLRTEQNLAYVFNIHLTFLFLASALFIC